MGRAMRTTRRAQWQRVGRRASGAGLAWHIWQEQNVPCGNGRMMWRIPSAAHGRFVLRDSSLFQNRTSEPKHAETRGTSSQLDGTESPAVAIRFDFLLPRERSGRLQVLDVS